jgi:PAS domain S-box-containing protein
MVQFFKKLFESDFLPHGTCYLWNPAVLWLNVISDLIITLAYYAIPILLFIFVRKRKDFRSNWIVLAFTIFILACGTTHLLGVWTVWHATYRLDGIVKAITAAASITTALLLAPLLPVLVHMPNPAELAAISLKLDESAKEREKSARRLQRQSELLDLAQDAIMVREWDGTISFWNRGAESLYGWRAEEALGQVKHDLLETQFPEPLECIMEKVVQSGYWEGELGHTRRDGTKVTVLSRWASRSADDGGREILEINTDISEWKRIAEQRHATEQLQQSAQQLREFAARLNFTREEERSRISRELHDELGQALTAIKMEITWAMSKLHEQPPVMQKMQSAIRMVDSTIHSVRKIATELRPAVLDLGLVAAIEWQAHEFQARTGTECQLDLPSDEVSLGKDKLIAVFRVLQETLTNVARHSGATRTRIILREQLRDLVLEIHDNGKGMSLDQVSSGSLGLLGMRERALSVGGELTIRSSPGEGTVVTARIPLG